MREGDYSCSWRLQHCAQQGICLRDLFFKGDSVTHFLLPARCDCTICDPLLPLLPTSAGERVFSQVATFLPFLLVFQGFLPLLAHSLRIPWVFGLIPVLVSGLYGWLDFGGAAYLQHYLLRWILWRSRALPWHYVRFLEEATERILLQRVGGGYRFIHPLFLEHFAAQGTEAPPDPILQSSRQQP